MTQEELRSRLADAEDNFTERKLEGVNRAAVRQTMVAFANSVPLGAEAVLFIGVSNDGKPVGVKDPDDLQKKTIKPAAEDCYPPIKYTAQVLDFDGAAILVVVIGPSDVRPHFAGPAYVRRGSESVVASPELYEELIASRNTTAGILLRHKGQRVTIISRKPLGSTTLIGEYVYKEKHEGIIVDCNAHVLTFSVPPQGAPKIYQEPLDRVRILGDNPMTIEISE